MLHENCEIGLVVHIIKQNENKSALIYRKWKSAAKMLDKLLASGKIKL